MNRWRKRQPGTSIKKDEPKNPRNKKKGVFKLVGTNNLFFLQACNARKER